MREVTLSTGETVTVRGLRRSEIKSLSKYGIGYMRCNIFDLPEDQKEEAIDAVVDTQFKDQDLENADLLKIFNQIIKESFSSEDEEKNSPRSGPSDQTAPEGSTATHA